MLHFYSKMEWKLLNRELKPALFDVHSHRSPFEEGRLRSSASGGSGADHLEVSLGLSFSSLDRLSLLKLLEKREKSVVCASLVI